MTFEKILQGVTVIDQQGDFSVEINQLRYRSNEVLLGDLFCAWQGQKTDGHDYIPEALNNGATALLTEKNVQAPPQIAWARVESGKKSLAVAAANYFGNPAQKLSMIGITGTNGKTSTASLLHYLLEHSGKKSGLLGTIEYRIGSKKLEADRTTPESLDLQRMLAEMVQANCGYCVMEVSSHALALDRLEGVFFSHALFTNLTQDHLDFHGGMENYFLAKQKLFKELRPGAVAIINIDDLYGRRLMEEIPSGVELITYSKSENTEADWVAEKISYTARGTEFICTNKEGRFPVQLPWVGEFNISNALVALAAARHCGISMADLMRWLPNAPVVSGRLERVVHEAAFQVLVDYAHTDDAIKNILTSLRPLTQNKLKILIGCGGDRDVSKRPLMALAACSLADEVIFTSDNPRSEDPQAIIQQMKQGVGAFKNLTVIIDREQAIARLIEQACAGDVIVLAGKGHETTQETNGVKIHFSDSEVAHKYLRKAKK